MSMTRSDFLAISGALRKVRTGYAPTWSPNLFRAQRDCAIAVADAIAAKTPAGVFDRSRFLHDCGLTAEG